MIRSRLMRLAVFVTRMGDREMSINFIGKPKLKTAFGRQNVWNDKMSLGFKEVEIKICLG